MLIGRLGSVLEFADGEDASAQIARHGVGRSYNDFVRVHNTL
jgi:hypothetical protein